MIEHLQTFIDIILHLDVHLARLSAEYGTFVYAILCIVIFCETGLVATPFLPGDSLLFAAGAVAATSQGTLSPHLLVLLLLCAPLLGDNCNYWVGRFIGPRVFKKPKSLLFNPEHLQRTHAFYERHGSKAIIIARFAPIIRTFAPFVAGIGRMRYPRFLLFSAVGALLWVPTFIYAGYFFGNIPFIKKNFTLVVFAIIGISLLPAFLEFLRQWRGKKLES